MIKRDTDMRSQQIVSCSRRELLAGILISARGLAGMTVDNSYIDAHVHIWTPDTVRYPRAPHYSGPSYEPASFEPEELLSHARPAGVGRIVLVQMSFYGTDNSYMLAAMAKYKPMFSGVAVVDHNAPGVEAEMLRLARLGVRGFRILPGVDGAGWLKKSGMSAMWRCGAEKGLAMSCLVNPEFLPSVDDMCRRFPGTPVVIDHLARIGADGSVRAPEVKALCALARHKNVNVKVSAFYALGKKQFPYTDLTDLIRAVYESFGAQRLMWASDSPFQVQPPYTYQGSIDLVRNRLHFFTDEDRKWLLSKTAERLFFHSATLE
jgi:predicted TIM-barrel fold metal-dependent hydrolase